MVVFQTLKNVTFLRFIFSVVWKNGDRARVVQGETVKNGLPDGLDFRFWVSGIGYQVSGVRSVFEEVLQ